MPAARCGTCRTPIRVTADVALSVRLDAAFANAAMADASSPPSARRPSVQMLSGSFEMASTMCAGRQVKERTWTPIMATLRTDRIEIFSAEEPGDAKPGTLIMSLPLDSDTVAAVDETETAGSAMVVGNNFERIVLRSKNDTDIIHWQQAIGVAIQVRRHQSRRYVLIRVLSGRCN